MLHTFLRAMPPGELSVVRVTTKEIIFRNTKMGPCGSSQEGTVGLPAAICIQHRIDMNIHKSEFNEQLSILTVVQFHVFFLVLWLISLGDHDAFQIFNNYR